jgi:hypothetical protein
MRHFLLDCMPATPRRPPISTVSSWSASNKPLIAGTLKSHFSPFASPFSNLFPSKQLPSPDGSIARNARSGSSPGSYGTSAMTPNCSAVIRWMKRRFAIFAELFVQVSRN